MKQTWLRKALAVLLCGIMLCAVGCGPTDDTAVTTTTAQGIVTTTTTQGDVDTDDTTTTVEGEDTTTVEGEDTTTTVEDEVTTTLEDEVTTTLEDEVTTTVKDKATTTKNKVTTTKNKVTTTTKNKVTTTTKNKVTTTQKPIVTTTQKATTTVKDKVTTTKNKVTTTTKKDTTTTKPVQSGPLVVTCYGDSVTEGMSVALENKYPTVLQGLLGDGYTVQNAGDGGERTTCIMARQGALKLYTKKELVFMAKQTTLLIDEGTGRGVVTENGLEPRWTSPFGRDVAISKVTINGQSYKLQFENFDWGNCHCETYLVREGTPSKLKALTIPKGSEVILETTTVSKNNYCDIYLMGFNGTYSDIDDLIAQYQKMIDYRGNDNYLVIIPFWNKNDAKAIEAYPKFKAAFGDHALDLVQYCVDGGMEKAGLTATAEDQDCIANNIVPYSLKLYGSANKSDVHLSAKGYKVLAHALYDQGKKVNLW